MKPVKTTVQRHTTRDDSCWYSRGGGALSVSITIDPTNKFGCVTKHTSNNVSDYSIDASTGSLTALSTVTMRNSGSSMVMTKGTRLVTYTPQFAYVTNLLSDNVLTYTINPSTGALTSVGTAVTGGGPVSVTTTGTVEQRGELSLSRRTITAPRSELPEISVRGLLAGSSEPHANEVERGQCL